VCILRFYALAGYLQTYETLLTRKELRSNPGHPGSDRVEPEVAPAEQYAVDCVALADRNFNVPSESGIRYPSLIAMIHRRDMSWRMASIYVFYTGIYVHDLNTSCYIMIRTCTQYTSGNLPHADE
jgi:hypothetical protein